MTTIKLEKNEDIVSVIKRIKDLKENEVIFELEKGSLLLSSSANLKLIKRTGETLGKKILVTTTDELGRLLAIKAGVLADQTPEDLKKIIPTVSSQPPSQKIFGDLKIKKIPAVSLPITPPVKASVQTVKKAATALAAKYLPPSLPAPSRFKKVYRVIAGIVILVIIAGVISAFLLPRADITVYARSEPITRDIDLKVDKNTTVVDATTLTIPGQVLTSEVSQTRNFPATGTSLSGTKAQGLVLIYNGLSTTLKLRAATTTLIADGKKFFFTADVSDIKRTTEASNPNIPVSVVAEQPGEGYNLPANTKFQIVNAALGNVPEVYAISTDVFTGGSSTATLMVSQEDLDMALFKSTDELINSAQQKINEEQPGWRLLPSGVNKEILAQTANKNVGDAADSFDFTLIARFTGLAYKEDDIKNLLNQQIKEMLSEDKYLVEGAEQMIDAEFASLDLQSGLGSLSVHFETLVAYKIDTNSLTKLLSGKKATEIKEILLSKPEVDRVDVKFWPFFVRKAPRLNGKIYVNTALSQM